ncbi:condensin-2 complex subunit G2-like [Periplaneta americana]|uniref:condensin-2 complex subunit G2-like n=1 Tax=Periplaneta americana TaxID=6978 RepID=UPI0037E7A836
MARESVRVPMHFVDCFNVSHRNFSLMSKEDVMIQISLSELNSVWSDIRKNCNINVTLFLEEEHADQRSILIQNILFLAEQCINISEPFVCEDLVRIMLALQDFLLDDDVPMRIQKKIAHILTLWCIKGLLSTHVLCVKVFHYLLSASLRKKALLADIKQLWKFCSSMWENSWNGEMLSQVKPLLLKMVHSERILNVKCGCRLVAFFLCYEENFVVMLHEQIKIALKSCSKKQATAYGEIYCLAMRSASAEIREVIGEVCLKDLILHVLQARRHEFELSKLGQQLMNVLNVIHSNMTHATIGSLVVKVYNPHIWRFITSSSNIYRANTAEVLLQLYPFQHPVGHSMENRRLLELQYDTIAKLLTDNCHIIRITTCREICRILYEFWPAIPVRWRHQYLQVLIRDLSTDGSCFEVRRSVYKYMSSLLKNEKAADFMKTMLPELQKNIHDKNEKVRLAFVQLLLNVKRSGLLCYWKIVPADLLIVQLERERSLVGEQLAALMMSNILAPKQSFSERLKRITCLASKSLRATRKLFLYSKQVLEFTDAVELMEKILKSLTIVFVGNKENVETAELTPFKPNWSPDVVCGLLDIVIILWLLHKEALNDVSNREKLKTLYQWVQTCYPALLQYYKDSEQEVLKSLLLLGSLVPVRLMEMVCTASGFCMSRLRNLPADKNAENSCVMWVSSLCSWKRSAEIFDYVLEWLDEAFRTQDLNYSATAPLQRKKRRVQFCDKESKPMLALHVMDALFSIKSNRSIVMSRRDLVLDLWTYLSRIKLVIEQRMLGPLKSPILCDKFLELCLLRYLKLTVILGDVEYNPQDEESEIFNACEHIILVFGWAHKVVLPHIPEHLPAVGTPIPLSVNILKNLTKVADVIIALKQTNDRFNVCVIEHLTTIMETGCALSFAHSVVCVMHRLVEYSIVNSEHADTKNLLRSSMPALIQRMLDAFKKENYSEETVKQYVENMDSVRVFLKEVLQMGLRYYGVTSKFVCGIIISCVDAVVSITANRIKEEQTVEPLKKVNALPYTAAQILRTFQQNEVYGVMFLYFMKMRIRQQYTKDKLQIVAAVQIIHVLVFNSGAMLTRDLKSPALAAETALTKIRSVSSSPSSSSSSSSSESSTDHSILTVPTASSSSRRASLRELFTSESTLSTVDSFQITKTTKTLLSAAGQMMNAVMEKLGLCRNRYNTISTTSN